MYFLFSEKLYESDAMRELSQPQSHRDSAKNTRKLALIELCYKTANGTEYIQSASDLARLVDTTAKQAKIVWDILIKNGVLRKGPKGYSARPWMIERGILGDFERKHRKSEPQQSQQPQQPQYPSKSKNIF